MYKMVSNGTEIIANDSASLYNKLKDEKVISDLKGDPYEIYLLNKHYISHDSFKNESGEIDLDSLWEFIENVSVLTDGEIKDIIIEQLDKVECILMEDGCIVLKNTKLSLLTRILSEKVKKAIRGMKHES